MSIFIYRIVPWRGHPFQRVRAKQTNSKQIPKRMKQIINTSPVLTWSGVGYCWALNHRPSSWWSSARWPQGMDACTDAPSSVRSSHCLSAAGWPWRLSWCLSPTGTREKHISLNSTLFILPITAALLFWSAVACTLTSVLMYKTLHKVEMKVALTVAKDNDSPSNIHNNYPFHHSGTSMHWEFTFTANINKPLWVCRTSMKRKEPSAWMGMYAHLPVEDDAPDEPQGQLVISVDNIRPSYVHQVNLKMRQKRNDVTTFRAELETLKFTHFKCC